MVHLLNHVAGNDYLEGKLWHRLCGIYWGAEESRSVSHNYYAFGVIQEILRNPGLAVIYSKDEDVIVRGFSWQVTHFNSQLYRWIKVWIAKQNEKN